ncbi:Na:phosphate symporter [Deferribacter desulfuricans SSM1]|uniref:Na:phosphate symporter n=1 Tax=Deferribacter desulfuricans (strain DSM 14783 / JCM 11476 / NBRC 101012 / SSM1) TaxID=639282 RepID=D3PAH0_DEFDS|nr:Na/Pi cotransporter family protein [Deferribacter desulfuricans]BAI79593.1 Na:phosphate symporter [Deferribacter desulfuricans SSM1]
MAHINWFEVLSGLFGGLGLFLMGMKFMSEGLQKAAGKGLRSILEKLTTNRIIGVIVGLIVTSIIQSSSATTVMVVGFVNAGLMNLSQALSVVLGANIGTTMTAQLIAFKVGKLALPAVAIGAALRLFSKNKKRQYIGEVLIGFGLLFIGLKTMEHAFVPLRKSQQFTNMFLYFSKNPLAAIAAGAALTMIVQSSSAMMGITIALATTGLIDYSAAIAFVLGENIGTTITANLAAIGANSTAKRAAFGHFLFNFIGVFYMFFLLKIMGHFIDVITPGDPYYIDPNGTAPYVARHIANFHTAFNVINTIIFLPLLGVLGKLCEKVIKEDKKKTEFVYIDDRLIDTPALAIAQAKKEVERMSNIALSMLKDSKKAFFNRDLKLIGDIYAREDIVDQLEKDITVFVVQLFQKPLSEENSKTINNILHVLHEIEKIADHSENIAKFTERIIEKDIHFSPQAMKEMEEIFNVAIKFAENILKIYNSEVYDQIVDTEDENIIDELRKEFKNNHMKRLNEGVCNVDAGIVYVDILNNLEKVGDHTFNIAQIIKEFS